MFTLPDEVMVKIDRYAKKHKVNRSRAVEHVFVHLHETGKNVDK